MSQVLEGRVALVTGAAQGIGRAEALALAKAGARVVVNDLKNGEEVAAVIKDAGGEALFVPASVDDLDQAEALVFKARSHFGGLDILVNNAGILRDRTLVNMSTTDWDDVIRVHLRGTFLLTRAFARAVKVQGGAKGGAAVVNTTSVSGFRGTFGQTNYSAAKAGIFGFTRSAALELAKLNIRVNAVAPVALTQMTEKIPRLQKMGIENLGPQHIAPVVIWLASPLAEGITGKAFGVEGTHVFEFRVVADEGLSAPPEGSEMWTAQALAEAMKLQA
jgi:NAD(P)-dependent dehydrogenase (short-subunit alcohol dehydrogenase family)